MYYLKIGSNHRQLKATKRLIFFPLVADSTVCYQRVSFHAPAKLPSYPTIRRAVLCKVNSSRCDAGCSTTRMRSTRGPINTLCRQSRDGPLKLLTVLNLTA